MQEQRQGQEVPMEEFVQETHITVGELLMQNRMANRVIVKLQGELTALRQKREEKEITSLNPGEEKKPELNLEKQSESPPAPMQNT